MLPLPSATEARRRVPRLVAGLALFGVGIGLMVQADLGLAPWDVLHQGLAERTDIAIGTVTVLTSFTVLLLWVPLRERPGLGTLLNAVLIGLVENITIAVVDRPGTLVARIGLLLVGVFLIGPGSGLYIGAGLGPGPRDGLMTGLARRGQSVRVARTAVELAALVCGLLLGGRVGIGTVLFAGTVGPNVHWFLHRWPLPSEGAGQVEVRGEREGGTRPPHPRRSRLRRS
jgi:uncharacterized membrane protein YczE